MIIDYGLLSEINNILFKGLNMSKFKCECCGYDWEYEILAPRTKTEIGNEQYLLCDFCRSTTLGNSVLMGVPLTNEQLGKLMAKFYNDVMVKLWAIRNRQGV